MRPEANEGMNEYKSILKHVPYVSVQNLKTPNKDPITAIFQ